MCGTANSIAHLVQHDRIGHVTNKNLDIGKNVGFQKIDADQLGIANANAAPVGNNLQPATRRTAQIDNRHARAQQFVAIIDLCQLQRSA